MDIITDFFNIAQDSILSVSSRSENNVLTFSITLVLFPIPCPVCGITTKNVKEYKIRKIKHSILNRKKCVVEYRARRFICKECGKTFYEDNPFVPTGHTISNLTVLNVLSELKETNATFSSASHHNFISPTKAQEIFDLYIHIPRRKFPEIICIDEVYALKDNHSKYVCILLDFKSHEMIDMLPDRKKFSLLNYFDKISIEERSQVKYMIMDMYQTYRDVAHSKLKNVIIAADSFHVIKNINSALDHVRKRIMKGYKSSSEEYYLLKHFSWLLFEKEVRENQRKYNHRLKRYINYPQLLDLILNISDELKEAYDYKEKYQYLNTYSDYENIKGDLDDFLIKTQNIKVAEMIAITKMLNHWRIEIENSFIRIDGRRLSNGIMESRNSIVKLIKKTGNGYVNFARFRNRCMYCMNKDAHMDISGSNTKIKMHGYKRGKYKKL